MAVKDDRDALHRGRLVFLDFDYGRYEAVMNFQIIIDLRPEIPVRMVEDLELLEVLAEDVGVEDGAFFPQFVKRPLPGLQVGQQVAIGKRVISGQYDLADSISHPGLEQFYVDGPDRGTAEQQKDDGPQ